MPKDDATWLNMAYVVFGLLIAYVGYNAIDFVGIRTGWVERYDSWFPMAATIGALVVAVASTWSIRRDDEKHQYYLASIGEIRKVTWPTWPDTKRMTIVVCVVVAVFAVILALFDMAWSAALQVLIG